MNLSSKFCLICVDQPSHGSTQIREIAMIESRRNNCVKKIRADVPRYLRYKWNEIYLANEFIPYKIKWKRGGGEKKKAHA